MHWGAHGRWLGVLSLSLSALLVPACRRDMQDQPKYLPLQASSFFVDGRSARPIPPNTIARGHLNDNDPFHTGADNGTFLNSIPMTITKAMLDRGQQRYGIYCTPCHGELGDGNGPQVRPGVYERDSPGGDTRSPGVQHPSRSFCTRYRGGEYSRNVAWRKNRPPRSRRGRIGCGRRPRVL